MDNLSGDGSRDCACRTISYWEDPSSLSYTGKVTFCKPLHQFWYILHHAWNSWNRPKPGHTVAQETWEGIAWLVEVNKGGTTCMSKWHKIFWPSYFREHLISLPEECPANEKHSWLEVYNKKVKDSFFRPKCFAVKSFFFLALFEKAFSNGR